jgi:hypothetical protein
MMNEAPDNNVSDKNAGYPVARPILMYIQGCMDAIKLSRILCGEPLER